MTIREHVPLSELTTFKVGGLARYVATCTSVEDVQAAVALARSKNLPLRVIGEGSNILASDDGYEGVLVHMCIGGITYEEQGDDVLVTAGAGVLWDALVEDVAQQSLWGLENMAGVPGTTGAAPVQNIGAYGAELKSVFSSAKVYDSALDTVSTYTAKECAFQYRDSVFKHNRSLIICSVTLKLSRTGEPHLGYSDLAELVREGMAMSTPLEIGVHVRRVRARKFPDLATHGTAGSFFKNPIVTSEVFNALCEKYGAIPSYPAGTGVKIPLAFILDKLLRLNGYREGKVSHFGTQPLVIVAEKGATQKEIHAFAHAIEKKVEDTFGICIEREVQAL